MNKLYISSPSEVLKQALSILIKQKLGIDCISLKDAHSFSPKQDRDLCLVDCSGKMNKDLWDLIEMNKFNSVDEHHNVALFNVNSRFEVENEVEVYRRGFSGIFFENEPLNVLFKGIKTIINGELWFSRNTMSRLLKEEKKNIVGNNSDDILLTKREKEILDLISLGYSNTEISDRLHISPHTVKNHAYNLYRKIGVHNRLQAAFFAVNKKLLRHVVSSDS